MKAIVMEIAIILPVLLSSYYLDNINIGVSVALGVLFCSAADIPGSVKHNFYGILLAVVLSMLVTLLFGSIMNFYWLLIPVLGIAVFFISYLSVFGFRASLIAFGTLMAIVLSFSHDSNETSLVTHALLIGLGGVLYLSLSMLQSFLFPKAQTDFLFGEVTEKTATFLRIRGELLMRSANRSELYKELFQLKTEINGLSEILRTIILQTRKESELSNRIRRQQLFFSILMDILELAISNPVDYDKLDVVFEKDQDKVALFKDLIFEMADELDHISKVIRKEEKLIISEKLEDQLTNIGREIDYYRILVGLPKSRVGTLMLLNLKKYQEKQVQNITDLKRILGNYSYNNKIAISRDINKFITPQDYDFKKLQENFSFKSPIFKHSLRLAIVFLIGFFVGGVFEMQNPYWIMLTIIVIMRPSFGLTKERSLNRVIGTLIGGAIAVAVILFTQNTIIYGVISIISLPIAFSVMQKNYRNAAIFITLNVIFVYALFEPNILSVIKFRIFDTLIGATLSFVSIYFLWPSWEFQNVGSYIGGALTNNKKFLEQISFFYHEKGEVTITYKLSRKAAFLAVGNLNAAFERMIQDPKSKQKDLGTIYELVVMNNTFLSSISSLGTFIRHNKTSDVPAYFDVFIENIKLNLELSLKLLEENESGHIKSSNIKKAHLLYENSFKNLSNKRDEEIAQGFEVSTEMAEQLKETHLVSEQVKWLYSLSEKMVDAIKQFKY